MKPIILTIASSLSAKSRSTAMAHHAHSIMAERGDVDAQFVDLACIDIGIYPRSENDPAVNLLAEQFERSDGFVLATPVYNWHAGANLENFLHYVLDPAAARRYRPFVILGGAGSSRSQLALDGLGRTMLSEIHGLQVGPPIIASGAESDSGAGEFSEDLKIRIARAIGVLADHAIAAKSRISDSVGVA
jgi:NAD(P)H-dependent FMN reductase